MMSCPPEIAEVLLRILERGILRIRSLGWSQQADLCAVEADHIHNLPDLLGHFSREKLSYYWDVERPAYLMHLSEGERAEWETVWQGLSTGMAVADSPARSL